MSGYIRQSRTRYGRCTRTIESPSRCVERPTAIPVQEQRNVSTFTLGITRTGRATAELAATGQTAPCGAS